MLLEELISTEFEGTLEEITGSGRTETGPDSASTLLRDDLLEATDETAVVCSGIKLDPGLDATELSVEVLEVFFWVAEDKAGYGSRRI